ncbi:MAG TPA: dephospho-CoA kinase [Thermodesulfovibrionales bacterium]|nr:dephospho-CoA kinase [Thermodesulfovibrionales bacterium]
MYNSPVLVVGLTGNYGMGKSTVLGLFRELGAVTLKTDGIVDLLLHDAGVLTKLRQILGDSAFADDGTLIKAKVAAAIFRDRGLREAVEGLLHPLVFEKIADILGKLRKEGADKKVVVVEIPLLFEKEYSRRFGKTVTVYTDLETALSRLGEKGVSRNDALSRLSAQMPVEEKIGMSDLAIDNSGTLDETRKQVVKVFEALKLIGERDDRHSGA